MGHTHSSSIKFFPQVFDNVTTPSNSDNAIWKAYEHLEEICTWYKQRLQPYPVTVTVHRGCLCIRGRLDLAAEILVDPDDEGNHPITLNNMRYMVSYYVYSTESSSGINTGMMRTMAVGADAA